jgi:UPF0755 protein
MRRRSPLLAGLTLFISFLLCVMILLLVNLTLVIPRRAAQTFGLPSNNVSYPLQIYYAALLVLQEKTLTQPVDPGATPQPFIVALGEPASSVIQRLFDEGLIASPEAFRVYLLYSGLDTSIQAGEIQLSPAMNAIEIAHHLQDSTPARVSFRIFAGWRLEEIAAALPTSGMTFPPEEFLASARIPRNGYVFSDLLPSHATLEGFLFPDTYEITRTLTLETFIRTTLENFQNHLTPDLLAGFDSQGLDIFEAVILASIIEREAVQEEEMPLIASVFINRLTVGMKLDSDPTVQYAIGFNKAQNTWWTNPLSLENLEIDSPYNTYKYSGLPPGPIASPGLAALRAVAFPASSSYYYFRAACDGSGRHVFALTFEEHVANACP